MTRITPKFLLNTRIPCGISAGRDRSGKFNITARIGRLRLWLRQSPWYCPEIGDNARYVDWR